MTTILRVIGFASGEECPISGQYLQNFDHEANDGLGYGVFTRDPKKALKFKNGSEALRFWRRIPEVRPTRSDGLPNRPLTATSMDLVSLETVKFR